VRGHDLSEIAQANNDADHPRDLMTAQPNPPRRRFLTRRRFYSTLGATLLGGWGYARYVEAAWLDVVYRDLPYPNLPASLNGMTIAQVSDLHIGSTEPDYLTRTLQHVGSLRPDLIVLTGDVLTDRYAHQPDLVPPFLEHLGRPPLGTFAILGNHDYGPTWKDAEIAGRVTELSHPHFPAQV
jgi:predicted MPP superfamily phosphohydrolase